MSLTSFIQKRFIKHIIYARYSSKQRDKAGNETDKYLSLSLQSGEWRNTRI